MQPVLLGQLLPVAPVLNLPDTTSGDQHQQHSDQFQRGGIHGTSLKNRWRPSFSVSLAPFTQAGGFDIVVV
ncbi:hypothetical protein D3C75_969990 [compost metagenome]